MAPGTGRRRVSGVLASFTQVDAAVEAIRALRAQGHRNLVVYTAFPNHEIEEALAEPVSMVRLFTLVGGLLGCAAVRRRGAAICDLLRARLLRRQRCAVRSGGARPPARLDRLKSTNAAMQQAMP